mmetsp:Transcript_23845/g.55316  ORF Transcript_23845/g.55316 Transcript_23845/m.55316 type:complete len:218 (+) Transcript_23845:5663-6316(+)
MADAADGLLAGGVDGLLGGAAQEEGRAPRRRQGDAQGLRLRDGRHASDGRCQGRRARQGGRPRRRRRVQLVEGQDRRLPRQPCARLWRRLDDGAARLLRRAAGDARRAAGARCLFDCLDTGRSNARAAFHRAAAARDGGAAAARRRLRQRPRRRQHVRRPRGRVAAACRDGLACALHDGGVRGVRHPDGAAGAVCARRCDADKMAMFGVGLAACVRQ